MPRLSGYSWVIDQERLPPCCENCRADFPSAAGADAVARESDAKQEQRRRCDLCARCCLSWPLPATCTGHAEPHGDAKQSAGSAAAVESKATAASDSKASAAAACTAAASKREAKSDGSSQLLPASFRGDEPPAPHLRAMLEGLNPVRVALHHIALQCPNARTSPFLLISRFAVVFVSAGWRGALLAPRGVRGAPCHGSRWYACCLLANHAAPWLMLVILVCCRRCGGLPAVQQARQADCQGISISRNWSRVLTQAGMGAQHLVEEVLAADRSRQVRSAALARCSYPVVRMLSNPVVLAVTPRRKRARLRTHQIRGLSSN